MVDLAPFRGLRFDPDVVGDLASVTAPPYDAIDPDEQERLHAASPYNIVRLELGQDRPDDRPGHDRYARSGDAYRRWRREGVLAPDPADALYAYEVTITRDGHPRRQTGLLGALAVTPWEAGDVLPHERIFRGPVEDRKRLLAALPANLSPVFVLTATTPSDVASLLDGVRSEPALIDVTDGTGARHRLWAITDPAAHRRVAASLAGTTALMADGHHRYTTAQEHHAEHPGPGTDRILAYVVGADRGPLIDPSHRLVRRLPEDLFDRIRAVGFDVEPHPATADELATVVRAEPVATIGLLTSDGSWLLRGRQPHVDALVADQPTVVAELDITLLQALLLGPLGIPDDIDELRYVSDTGVAEAQVRAGAYDGLFVVRPVTFDQFRAASEAGVRMPPKSTTFVPKPRTGLVLRPLDPAGMG